MDNKKLEELIAVLTAQRDELLKEANGQLAYLNGKIDALKGLIELEEQSEKQD